MNDSWTLVLILSALWAGCGASPPTIDAGPTLSDAGSSDAGASNDAGATGSTVTGSVNGTTPFGTVATALWIGAADSAATTVVYLFNKSVTCAELSPAGWDARITDNTEVLELKMYGTAPASYAVTPTLPRAWSEWTLSIGSWASTPTSETRRPESGARERPRLSGTVSAAVHRSIPRAAACPRCRWRG